MKRFWKVLALNKNQTEIELDGRKIVISPKEKKLARIAQSIMEFIPLFTMFLVVNNPALMPLEQAGTVMGFLIVTVAVFGIFVLGCIAAYFVWRIGMRNEL